MVHRPRALALAAALSLAAVALPGTASAHLSDDVTGVVSADLGLERLQSARAKLAPRLRASNGLARPAAAAAALGDEQAPGRFELIGSNPLMNRGMNAALAVQKTEGRTYAYIGSRTDGSHLNSGVLVTDVTDPAKPTVVHEIGMPDSANLGESSRELRVLPGKDLLLVLNHGCSELIHRCVNLSQASRNLPTSNIRVYDVRGANAARPKLVGTYLPSRSAAQQPHEVFFWTDPENPERVLMYGTTPSSDTGTAAQLLITDFTRAREGLFPEIGTWRNRIGNAARDNRLHSLTVTHDGTRAQLAYLGGGFLVADTSDFALGRPDPQVRLVTPVANRVFWTDPGAHSAIKLPGRDFVMTTDEVYGKLGGVLAAHGCPWGWVRFIDIADPTRPSIASEYKLPVNDKASCAGVDPIRDNFASFSAHNPTLTENLAFVTWHSAGLQAIDTTDPRKPTSAGAFLPEPLPYVQTEDPALSSGQDKVVMWSFPVIVDGLIYVVDLRNGLYVLKYRGPYEKQVEKVKYLDGNSNSGDVGRMEKKG